MLMRWVSWAQEFDSGMQQAKKAHKQCIEALAKFWKIATYGRRLEKV